MHKKCGIHVVPKSNFSLCPLVRHGIQLTVAPRRDGGGRDWREKGGRVGRSEGEERLTAAGRGAKGRGKRGGRGEAAREGWNGYCESRAAAARRCFVCLNAGLAQGLRISLPLRAETPNCYPLSHQNREVFNIHSLKE